MRFKSSLWPCAAIAVSSSLAHAAPVRQIVPQGPTNFTSKEQRFAIWLPAQPKQRRSPYISPYVVETPELVAYTLIVARQSPDLPPFAPNRGRKNTLDSLANSYSRMARDSPESEIVEQNGFSGRDLTFIDERTNRVRRVRLFATGQWTYQISASGSAQAMLKQAAQIEKVFVSFQILPQKNEGARFRLLSAQ